MKKNTQIKDQKNNIKIMPNGKPRTEEQRKARHQKLHGNKNVPARQGKNRSK